MTTGRIYCGSTTSRIRIRLETGAIQIPGLVSREIRTDMPPHRSRTSSWTYGRQSEVMARSGSHEIMDLLWAPNGPRLALGAFEICTPSRRRKPRCLPEGGNDQNGRNGAHFLAALIFAQRALCAAAILLRPAAEMVLFFRLDFLPRR